MATEAPYKINRRPKDDVYLEIDEHLNDKEKAILFEGQKQLLFGRSFDIKSNRIKSAPKKLFKLKGQDNDDDEKIDLSVVVRQKDRKDVEIHESRNSLQQSLTTSSYFDTNVQATVAEFGGGSIGYNDTDCKDSSNEESTYYFTATRLIQKGEIFVNDDAVKYSTKFMTELDVLLDNDITSEKKWTELQRKYGQFYISECAIGGAAYSTKEEQSKDKQTREQKKKEFQASFEANAGITSIGASMKHGKECEDIDKSSYTSNAMKLNCRGGRSSECEWEKFKEWEKSVNEDHTLWDVIGVLEVQPFYHLLDAPRKHKVKELMPKKPETKEKENSSPLPVIIRKEGALDDYNYTIMAYKQQRWAILQSDPEEKTNYFVAYQESEKRKMKICPTTIIMEIEDDKDNKKFYIKNKGENKVIYMADTKEERDEWIQELQTAKHFGQTPVQESEETHVKMVKYKMLEQLKDKFKKRVDTIQDVYLETQSEYKQMEKKIKDLGNERYELKHQIEKLHEQLDEAVAKLRVIEDGFYNIRVIDTGKVLEDDYHVRINDANGGIKQKYNIKHVKDEWYTIQCDENYLTNCDGSDYFIFRQEIDPHHPKKQRFSFSRIGQIYFITNAYSGKILEVEQGKINENKPKITENGFTGKSNQRFSFKKC